MEQRRKADLHLAIERPSKELWHFGKASSVVVAGTRVIVNWRFGLFNRRITVFCRKHCVLSVAEFENREFLFPQGKSSVINTGHDCPPPAGKVGELCDTLIVSPLP